MSTASQSRRRFLQGKVAVLPPTRTRLPWVINEGIFTDNCNQCGDCLSACDQKIILSDGDGFPYLSFNSAECTFCKACVEVCQQLLFVNHKLRQPWLAELTIKDNCLARNHIYCQSCQDSCDQNAIKFKYLESSIPVPVIDNDLCNGCGACISVCPQKSTELKLNYE